MKHKIDDTLRKYDALLAYEFHPATATSAAEPSPASRRDQYLARLTPLHERLAAALSKFPPNALANGLHMDQVWPLVIGRQAEKPRAFEVAEALRRLGWTRVRFYSDSGPSQTAWFPPDVNHHDAKAILKGRRV